MAFAECVTQLHLSPTICPLILGMNHLSTVRYGTISATLNLI